MKKNTIKAVLLFMLCIPSCSFSAQEGSSMALSEQKIPLVVLPKKIFDECTSISWQRYNQTTPLLKLPSKILNQILNFLINPTQQIATNMKTSLNLSESCKFFNNMLPELGMKFHGCDQSEINREIYNLQKKSVYDYSDNYRRKLLLLINARGQSDKVFYNFSLLQDAVNQDDIEMASTLFKYGARSNEVPRISKVPVLFSIKSIEMFNLFSDHGANWATITPGGLSILHIKADNPRPTEKDVAVFEKLLQTIPKLINVKSIRDELTPLDYAKNVPKIFDNTPLIKLLIAHDAKIAEELISDAIWTETAILEALKQIPITPTAMTRIKKRIPLLKTRLR